MNAGLFRLFTADGRDEHGFTEEDYAKDDFDPLAELLSRPPPAPVVGDRAPRLRAITNNTGPK